MRLRSGGLGIPVQSATRSFVYWRGPAEERWNAPIVRGWRVFRREEHRDRGAVILRTEGTSVLANQVVRCTQVRAMSPRSGDCASSSPK